MSEGLSGKNSHRDEDSGDNGREHDLAALLTRHKREAGLGDARIASLANDRVNIANYVTRSSVRNWSSGSSSRVNNWRQLAAIAAVLQLDLVDAEELMAAGGCPSIQGLIRSAHADVDPFLTYWQDAVWAASADHDGSNEVDEPDVPDEPEIALGTSTNTMVSTSPSEDPMLAAPPQPTRSSSRPTLVVAAIVGVAALAALGLMMLRTSDDSAVESDVVTVESEATEQAATTTATGVAANDAAAAAESAAQDVVEESLPPWLELDLPRSGANLNGDLLQASGRAGHPTGVAEVQMILKNQGEGTYWNPVTGTWDPDFVRFTVPVDSNSSEVIWSYQMPVPVPSSDYRVRAWSLSTFGIIDPIGPKVDFVVDNEVFVEVPPGTGADPNGPHQIVVEQEKPDPVSAVTSPVDGSMTGADVTISGTAAHVNGVANVELVLRRIDPELYWDPEIADWSPEFGRFVVAVDSQGANQTTWSWQAPIALEPGEYRARVWARGSDDERDEARNTSDFTVVAGG